MPRSRWLRGMWSSKMKRLLGARSPRPVDLRQPVLRAGHALEPRVAQAAAPVDRGAAINLAVLDQQPDRRVAITVGNDGRLEPLGLVGMVVHSDHAHAL